MIHVLAISVVVGHGCAAGVVLVMLNMVTLFLHKLFKYVSTFLSHVDLLDLGQSAVLIQIQ